MLFAVLGDIHGNLPALEAALAEIDRNGIRLVCCTGDLVVGHPYPNEVIERLEAVHAVTVQGVKDRETALFKRRTERLRARLSAEAFAEVEETYRRTRSAHIETLRRLPRRVTTTAEGVSVLVCHSCPSGQEDGLYEDTPRGRFQRERECANVDIVACGMTHAAFSIDVDGTLFVNPGSLGMSPDGRPRGTFAIVDTDATPFRAEAVAVAYGG